MGSVRVTCALTLLNFPCELQGKPLSYLFLLFLPSCLFSSSSYSCLAPFLFFHILPPVFLQLQISNLKSCTYPSLSSHTHQRSNFITHHSWRPLSTSVYVEETECVLFLIMCSMISLRGVISLPLRAFLSLGLSLLASLKLFCFVATT